MNLPLIYNRDGSVGADGWIHIVPRGVLPHAEAGIDQVLDDTALDAIMASFAEDKRRLGNHWPGLYFGVEHHIYDPTKSSEALAWGKEFEKRADGIWSRPEQTDLGSEAIKNKRFKFTSFVADPRDLEPMGGKKFRVMKVETVGLTNFPNGKHLLKPITNRGGEGVRKMGSEKSGMEEEFRRGTEATAGSNKPTTERKNMKTIATRLGLSADASEEAVLAEVNKVMNRATEAEGKILPLNTRVTMLETANTALLDEQVDALLTEHGVKDAKVINRLKPLLAPLKNREERVLCLTELGIKANAGRDAGAPGGKVLNRGETKTPATNGGGGDQGDEQARAGKIRNRANALMREAPGRKWDACWAEASQELVGQN